MKTLSLAAVGLFLASTALAQATTPAGYLTTECDSYAYRFGYYADSHYQVVDKEIPSGVLVLTKISYRMDGRSHSTSTAMGRTWKSVTLDLSDGDYATMGRTFIANQLSTPTRVFSSSMNWPSVTGYTTSRPDNWSIAFPFQGAGTYIHAGTKDLLLDFQFAGGALANGGAFSGSSGKNYYLDGKYSSTATTYGRNVYKYMGTTTGDCRDSSRTSGYAGSSLQVGLYGTTYSDPKLAGQAALQLFGSNLAPSAPFVRAVGLGGTTPGISLSPIFGCYNLMIDFKQVVFYLTQTTNTSGSISPWLYMPIGKLTTLAPLGSVPIWSQGVFDDSVTKKPTIATAERCTPNFARTFSPAPKKKLLYQYNPTSTTGNGPYDYYYYVPLTRYN